ncbi:MAG: glycosyltransferase family 2 protein [Planctomycetota bacterium]|jgi:glycosyltransferase involved in cell wall biosynthesis
MPRLRVLLAIPVYNEQRYIHRVLRQARAHVEDILVVDDGSTDRTPQILAGERGLHTIRHSTNLGYGQSLIDAFDFALGAGYDWVITMDCDEQHEPAFLPKFIAAARRDDADLISGSRYLADLDGRGLPPADRRRINAAITAQLNERLGLHITDAFCGFKAYRTEALRGLCITEPGYAMPMQLWVQAARAGWRIVELPVRLIYHDAKRQFGGGLDDPAVRYEYYLRVLAVELERGLSPAGAPAKSPEGDSVGAAC